MATVRWDNTISEMFAGVVTTILHLHRGGRQRRMVDSVTLDCQSTLDCSESILDFSQTEATLRLSSLGWGSAISLQASLGNVTGEQTERVAVFTREVRSRYLSPLRDVSIGWERAGEATLYWTNPNTPLDSGLTVPLVLRLYHQSRLVREDVITESQAADYSLTYRETQYQPWQLDFSLGLQGEKEGRLAGLMDQFSLLPPDEISVECREECQVTWCLPLSQIHIQVNRGEKGFKKNRRTLP